MADDEPMGNDHETRLDPHQLAALAAVVEVGSFDAAAEALHVTPSAVSQRIKTLEKHVGQVLVVREKPCAEPPLPAYHYCGWRHRRHCWSQRRWPNRSGRSAQNSPGSRSRSTPTRCRHGSPRYFVGLPDTSFISASRTRITPLGYCATGAVMGAVTTERFRSPLACLACSHWVSCGMYPWPAPPTSNGTCSDGFTRESGRSGPLARVEPR